jgi:hypothetical protein
MKARRFKNKIPRLSPGVITKHGRFKRIAAEFKRP